MIATAHRPIAAAGAALLGAGFIAATPALAPSVPAVPHLDAPQIALQASVLDIFKFPSLQQIAANQIEVLAIEADGLLKAGQGALQSVAQLPPALITATRQVLSGDALDALTTLEDWAVDSAKATFVPVITARIAVGQIDLAIQSALLPAWPLALVSLASGLFDGADTITRGLITAGQDLVAAVLSFNLSEIAQAVVSGIRGVAASVVAGAQSAVDGVVGAQNLIADALAARPAPITPPAVAAAAKAPKAESISPKPAAAADTAAADQAGAEAVAAAGAEAAEAKPVAETPAPKRVLAHSTREAAPRRIASAVASAVESITPQADSAEAGSEKAPRRAGGRHAARAN